jgi:GxxExxY protein
MLLQDTTGTIIDAAIKIHRVLGPGLFESVYEEVMEYELRKQGLIVERQVSIPVRYEGLTMDVGFRADLIIDKEVIVENKSVETVKAVFKKQVLTYLRLTGHKIGLLINFNEEVVKDGITRLINNYVK